VLEPKPSVLFVCTGNAGRSQMAEALLRAALGDAVEAESAGVAPWPALHPMALLLMGERGINLTGRRPRDVRSVADRAFDLVVTIGQEALRRTPELPGVPRRIHWAFADPAEPEGGSGAEAAFRRALALIENSMGEVTALLARMRPADRLRHAPGISTCFVRPATLRPREHLPPAAEAGFRCIELNCYLGSADFAYDDPRAVDELIRALDETGLSVYSVHAPGGLLDLPGRGVMQGRAAVDMARFFADLTCALGARVTVVHTIPDPAMDRARADGLVRDCLRALEEHALGLPCVYGWENEWPGHSAQEHLDMLRGLNPGAFGFVLDTGHSNLAGDTDGYLAGCGLRLCDLHLNDNDGRGDLHLPPGRGSHRWDGFLDKLCAAGYEGPLMLEVLPPDGPPDLRGLLAEAMASIKGLAAADEGG
jgi:sugar phosphate isomerase/epimerase/protein-tyrosine-phosphatase